MPAEEEFKPFVEEVEKPINYRHYLILLQKNFYVILTFFLITLTLSTIYALKMPDQYAATAQLMLERPENPWKGEVGYVSESRGRAWADEYYVTQMEIMRSAAVLKQVVQELKLTDYYENPNEESVAGMLRGRTKVYRIGKSRLFNIRVSANDPQFSAKLANAVARAYIRKNFEDVLYYSKEILAWLPEDGKENEVVSIQDPFGEVKQMTRTQLIDSLPSIRTNKTIRGLEEKQSALEAEIKLMLQQYREKHPVVVKARANLKFIERSIEAEKIRVIEDLKATADGTLQVTQARIIEEAKPPKSPSGPNRAELIQVPSIISIVVIVLIIILLDYFDDTIHCVEDLERKGIMLPFLGPIPLLKVKGADRNRKALATYYEKKSEAAESFRFLRVAINFSASPESLRNLVFTSCLPAEGKSFITHNIAVSLALDGNRTLLVDGDLRRPIVHKVFQLENSTGLSNYLTSNINLEAVVKQSFVENLSIITSGPISPNPSEILGSDRMKHLLTECRKHYDRVIIDCPPLTGLGDGYVVGSLVGHIIIVIAAVRTPVNMVQNMQAQVNKMGIKIIGTILNMVDVEKERYGGYGKYYYHTYRRYYHEK
ncbi:MAG: polysaccharide biosynthesis tyrosine autokinase [Candidatus Omnitrophica bacterium]|nr:polysaccharide biosynthesis tyrosine autokinase [Candidatus Omnitrophota bacterium]